MEQINKNFSVGIIGAGEIVSKVHLPVLSSVENISISWITDADSNKGKALANAYNIPFIEFFHDLSNLPYADIVLLAIPFGNRNPYYEVLKSRSSALYVEKPFALTKQQHKEICSSFPEHNLACGFQRRSWGPNLLVKNLIENKVFGELKSARFELGHPAGFVGSAGFFSDIKQSGGGILFDVGVHGVDTILFCTNAKSFNISTAKIIKENGFDIHTKAKMIIKDSQDNPINCDILVSCLEETSNKLEFEFTNAIISYSLLDYNTNITLLTINGSQRSTLTSLSCSNSYPLTSFQAFYEHWSTFIKGIELKKTNRACASETLLTTEIIEALYKEGIA